MEDVKWLFRKYGILILVSIISTGIIIEGQRKKQEFQAEEVWEPPIEIENIRENKENERENDIADSATTESSYWLVPQAEECLISDEEKGELQKNVLSVVTLVSDIYKETIIPEEQKNVIGLLQEKT